MLPQGDHLFKRLSLDETMTRVWDVYRKGFLTYLMISAPVMLTSALAWSWIVLPFMRLLLGVKESTLLTDAFFRGVDDGIIIDESSGSVYLVEQRDERYFWDGIVLSALHGSLEAFLSSIAYGAMVLAISFLYINSESPNLNAWQCFRDGGLRNAQPLLMATMITGIGFWIGYLMLILPAIYLLVIWYVTTPVLVLGTATLNENEEGGAGGAKFCCRTSRALTSIKKSQELVAGSWCYCFCSALIGMVVMVVVKFLWLMFCEGYLHDSPSFLLYTTWGSILMAFPTIFTMPLVAIFQTVMYFNLKVEKEAMNYEVLVQDMTANEYDVHGSMGTVTNDQYGSYRQVALLEQGGNSLELHQDGTTMTTTTATPVTNTNFANKPAVTTTTAAAAGSAGYEEEML